MKRVMISAPYMIKDIERFKGLLRDKGIDVLVADVKERLSENDLLKVIGKIDGMICGDDRLSEKVLKEAKRLKVISKWGTGTDSIDKTACKKLGIKVCNTENAFTEPVADTVIGLILCFARNIIEMDQEMKKGKWFKKPGIALRECTLGVVGVGNIGRALIKRAKAFGMNTICNDIKEIDKSILHATHTKMKSIDELLKESDFVTITCDLNETSYHLIGKKEIGLMKKTAYLINTSRGSIVDENAMIEALKENKIAGAGLDVFENEPLPVNSPLKRMTNVIISPHNSNSSPEAYEKVHINTINSLIKELNL